MPFKFIFASFISLFAVIICFYAVIFRKPRKSR